MELLTIQKVVTPSTLSSSETFKETRVFADPSVFAPPVGTFSQVMLALDLPILIPLDRNIVPSGFFDTWGATTIHKLIVRVCLGTSVNDEHSFLREFPIPIKLYNTLPLYRQFDESVCESQVSCDKQVIVEVTLPYSAVGPHDTIDVKTRIAANHLYHKRKKNLQLKSVTLQLKEIFEGFDGGLQTRRELKLYSKTNTHESLLSTEGVENMFSFMIPQDNDLLELYNKSTPDYSQGEVTHISASFNKNKNCGMLAEGIPFSHVQSFTLIGKLYAVRYEVVVKVKLVHGKDHVCTIPLTVSPYNRASSEYLIRWIMGECQTAREIFGKEMVSVISRCSRIEDMYSCTRSYCPPPIVYSYNPSDWVELGFNPESFHNPRSDRRYMIEID